MKLFRSAINPSLIGPRAARSAGMIVFTGALLFGGASSVSAATYYVAPISTNCASTAGT